MNTNDILSEKERNDQLAWNQELKGVLYNKAMPVNVTIETTMKCNSRCIMCQVYRDPETMKNANVNESTMPVKLFEQIAEEIFPIAKTMSPTVMGEPLLTPYLDIIVEQLEKHSVKMNLVTNGSLLTESISSMLAPHLSTVKVSFDGANKRTFESIRRGTDYDLVIENVKKLKSIIDQMNSHERPQLIFQVTLMKKNIQELPAIVNLASEIGVDMVVGLHLYVFDPLLKDQSLFYHQQMSDKFIRDAEKKAWELNLSTHFPSHFNRTGRIEKIKSDQSWDQNARRCKFLWREVWVSNKGDVTPCCVPNRPIMGNLSNHSFKEIWNGDLYQEMRRRLNTRTPFDCCIGCSLNVQYEEGTEYDYTENAFIMY